MSHDNANTTPDGTGPVDRPVGRRVNEGTNACTHCGSVACANGGGSMNGYWVIHPGCDEAKAEKERA